MSSKKASLQSEIADCIVCADFLDHEPRPVVSFSGSSKIVLIGQAPGRKVHESGVPWDDASGERLREWLDVSSDAFYDPAKFAIVPMGFCYPGKGKSGDLPPRPECAPLWMDRVLDEIGKTRLKILIGNYAQKHFLGDRMKRTLTETVRNWREYFPEFVVLPHPSPRNNIWLKKNGWFESELVPKLKKTIKQTLE